MIGVFVYNVASVAALAYLAVRFEKWWIVLFAPLLAMTYKERVEDKK